MTLIDKLKKLLFDASLSEAEVFLYCELLKKPAETVWEMVLRTGLQKSTVYDAFSSLKKLKMVERTKEGIRALSLKALVSELMRTERKAGKTAYKIKQLAPFLHAPRESIEEFETYYTKDQVADAFLGMSELDYDVNLDFGDYEAFASAMGGNEVGFKFRDSRSKHAANHAVLTTSGPLIAEYCTKEAVARFKNHLQFLKNLDFKNRWIVFADKSDYVLFSDLSEPEFPTAALIKSKPVADIQRMQFKNFSGALRNL